MADARGPQAVWPRGSRTRAGSWMVHHLSRVNGFRGNKKANKYKTITLYCFLCHCPAYYFVSCLVKSEMGSPVVVGLIPFTQDSLSRGRVKTPAPSVGRRPAMSQARSAEVVG